MLERLVLAFYLAVGLRVEGGTKLLFYLRVEVDLRLEFASKDRPSVGDNAPWRSETGEDLLDIELREPYRVDLFRHGSIERYLRVAVNNN